MNGFVMSGSLRRVQIRVGVLLLGSLGLAVWSVVAQPVELVSLTNLWRYEQSGADLGTAWQEIAYDDSGWPSGLGVLADENSSSLVQALTNTILTRIGTNGVFKITDYFRTHFQAPELRAGWMLTASNLVDDGAVVYLNGAELFRLNMPTGGVTAATLASEWIGAGKEGIFVVTNLPTPLLRTGDNVLAVEVHQPYVTSSDVVLGLALLYEPQKPLAILSQPAHRVVAEGQTATLAVRTSGSLPRHQWFKDDAPVPGATDGVLAIPSVRRSDAGQYFVVVSNDLNAVTSRVVSLAVALDTQGPWLVSARGSPQRVEVRFSEALEPGSATEQSHYQIVAAGGASVPITSVQRYESRAVAIYTEPLAPGVTHVLTVQGVCDLFGNAILPGSGIAIATSLTNVPLASTWRYNDSGVDLGDAWRGPGFDDSAWSAGPALLYNDANLSLDPPGVRGTFLRVTNADGPFWTHYFRLRFTNSASPLNARLTLRQYLDDGAVCYLNGQEFYRVGIPPGPITATTRASSSAVEGVFSAALGVPATNLLAGENLLAVEVHQYSLASPVLPDITFGLELAGEFESFVDGPPVILSEPQDIRVAEGDGAVFRARVARAERLQWWRDGAALPGPASNSVSLDQVTVDDDGARFALVVSNALGLAVSRTARLTVVPDFTAPRLLSAHMGTNEDRVLLAFSEALEAASATLTGHYIITNESGEGLGILGATLTNGTNVVLLTAPRTAGHRYVVVVSGVRDVSAAGNTVASNGHIGVDHESLLFTYDWLWRYDDYGTNHGTSWRTADYDDTAWRTGPGLLGFDEATPPAPLLTVLAPPEDRGPTYYFRTRFSFAGEPASAILRLRHIIDDGAVFYLNGEEIHRVRVPAGQNYTTLAEPAVGKASVEGPFLIPAGALQSGLNTLAAEVHQNAAVSADIVFGAELVEAFPAVPSVPVGPTLQIVRDGGDYALSWEAPDFALEWADTPVGPWRLAPHPTVPYPLVGLDRAAFYRLRSEANE